MKNTLLKRVGIIVTVIFMMIALAVPALAGDEYKGKDEKTTNAEKTSSREEPYFYGWDEEEMRYIPYENPNYPKENTTMNLPKRKSASTELGITLSRKSYNVYTAPSTSSTKVGTIGSTKSREIVKVNSETTADGEKWYYITYKTSSRDKMGYIQAKYIDIPSRKYSYSKPVTGGVWTQDYGYKGHEGIDIAGSQTVYAFTSGTVNYKYAKFQHPDDDKWYLISYGNYAQQNPSIGKTTYAHLSSFANGVSASDMPSKQLSTGSDIVQKNLSRYEVVNAGNVSISAGQKIGKTGSTGNSTSTHLHFEISGKDPFKYVLFPDYGYVSQ
ncbi:MAG: peptidoglycan DD-metalloendopeptidase family protein [Tepidanaerobacteraceae bacterium]|nr:peptidoglycan DD-metalloendopeptidase family protein [Tepidanaerobacteraceae bacterium]